MKQFLFLILLHGFLFISGCKKDQDVESIPASSNSKPNLIPLKVGNEWTYFNVTYNAPSDTLSYNDNYAYSIEKDTLINGEKWFIQTHHSIIRNTSTGVQWYDDVKPDNQLNFAKYPINLNETYLALTYYYNSFQNDTCVMKSYMKCDSINFSIEIMGITYDSCYRYITDSIIYWCPLNPASDVEKYVIYYKPGIGMLKRERYIGPYYAYVKESLELINYHLN